MIKLGVLGSTKGTDLQAIISAINSKSLKAQVSVVISDRSKSYILERARLNQIPSFFVSSRIVYAFKGSLDLSSKSNTIFWFLVNLIFLYS